MTGPWPTPQRDWRHRRVPLWFTVAIALYAPAGFLGARLGLWVLLPLGVAWLGLFVLRMHGRPERPAWARRGAPEPTAVRRGVLGRTIRPQPYFAVALSAVALWTSWGLALSNLAPVSPLSLWLGIGVHLVAFLGVARLALQGGVDVRWEEVPTAGGPATFHVAMTTTRLDDASFLLRCVGPRADLGRLRDGLPDSGTLWAQELGRDPARVPGPEEFVGVTFDLPEGAAGARLDAHPPVYWELLVRGRTLWGPVTESFLVPVRGSERG